MGKIKIKVDKKDLPDEFIIESNRINSQEDLKTELGWHTVTQEIINKLHIQESFIEEEVENKREIKVGQKYRHFKGNEYIVLHVGQKRFWF